MAEKMKLPNGLVAQGVGRLRTDPKIKTFSTGTVVCEVDMAFNRNYKVNDEWQSDTTWMRAKCWGDKADKFKQFKKGDLVYVSGTLNQETWVKDGTNIKIMSLFVWEYKLLKASETTEARQHANKSEDNVKPSPVMPEQPATTEELPQPEEESPQPDDETGHDYDSVPF